MFDKTFAAYFVIRSATIVAFLYLYGFMPWLAALGILFVLSVPWAIRSYNLGLKERRLPSRNEYTIVCIINVIVYNATLLWLAPEAYVLIAVGAAADVWGTDLFRKRYHHMEDFLSFTAARLT